MSSQAAKDQLQGLGSALLDGFKLAVKAGRTAMSNPTVVAVHKQSFGRLVLLSIGVYTSIFMATLPLHFMLRMLHLVGKDTADYRTWLSQFATAAFFYLPVVLAFLVRWVFYRPLERAYFAVLKGLDSNLAEELEKMPRKGLREVLMSEARRIASLVMYYPVLRLLAYIPGVAPALKFLWSCYNFARWFEPGLATALAVLSAFPLSASVVSLCVQLFLAQMFVLLEISQPYLARKRLHRRDEIAAVTKQRVKALGFVLPFSVLLTIPYLGPFFWVTAHAAAPYALTELILPDQAAEAREDAETTAKTGLTPSKEQ